MKAIPVNSVKTAGHARDLAIVWQQVFSDRSSSYGELAEWQAYFEALAAKFPELKDEFQENGII